MNQHQRKFLLDQIERMYKEESSALNGRKPSEPSLNNYLIAAVLDGSAAMRPQKQVQESVRQRVRDLGKSESLVGGSRRWGSDEGEDSVSLPALLLFEKPPAYAEAEAKYAKALAAWEAERAALESSVNAMRIKVQVGSDAALAVLVDQADKLCSMSLTASSRLLLPDRSAK